MALIYSHTLQYKVSAFTYYFSLLLLNNIKYTYPIMKNIKQLTVNKNIIFKYQYITTQVHLNFQSFIRYTLGGSL